MTEFTQWRSLVDGERVSAIPDSVEDQAHAWYDAQEAFDSSQDGNQVTTWQDKEENFDATGTGATVREDGINGNIALEFDAVDDTFSISSSDWQTISPPNTIFIVCEFNGSIENPYHIIDQADDGDRNWVRWNPFASPESWEITAGDPVTGSDDTSTQLITAQYDSDGSIRENGSETGSGDTGSGDMKDLQIGSQRDEDRYWDGMIGEIVICDGSIPSEDIESMESYLSSKWDIPI